MQTAMWLKLGVAGLVVAFCTLLGYLAAAKYRARRAYFDQLYALNERFLSELAYSRRPVSELLQESGFRGEFAETVTAFCARKGAAIPERLLSERERAVVSDYFSMLGRGDAQSQTGYFTAKRQDLAAFRADSAAEAKKRGELYLRLGVLAGLAAVILIL